QIRRACDLLGAIAFELLSKTDEEGRPKPAFHGVDKDLDEFRKAVQRRFVAAGAMVQASGKAENEDDFYQDWDCLLAMDSHGLKHFIFSTDARDQQLRWTDITTMAFFAAYWACRWATDEELRSARAWVIDPLESSND